MRYINILAIGSNAHVLQSVTAICQLDVLYFGKAPHINNRDTGCHYIQVCRCAGKKFATNIYRPSLLNMADRGSRKTFTLRTTFT